MDLNEKIKYLVHEADKLIEVIPTVNSVVPRDQLKDIKTQLVKALILRDKDKIDIKEYKTVFDDTSYMVKYNGNVIGYVMGRGTLWTVKELRKRKFFDYEVTDIKDKGQYRDKKAAIINLLDQRVYEVEIRNWTKKVEHLI